MSVPIPAFVAEFHRKSRSKWEQILASRHKEFLDRVQPYVRGEVARTVLAEIHRCRASREGSEPYYRCRFPSCPSCGDAEKQKMARSHADQVRKWIRTYGTGFVSFVTVCAPSCELDRVWYEEARFRRSFANLFLKGRGLSECQVVGELELTLKEVQKSARNSVFEVEDFFGERVLGESGVSDFLTFRDDGESVGNDGKSVVRSLLDDGAWGRGTALTHFAAILHIHGVLVHPGRDREEIKKTLKRCFRAKGAVSVLEIKEPKRERDDGLDAVQRILEYAHDKSGCMKGWARSLSDPALQAKTFALYCDLAGGTRRRPKIALGRVDWG